MTGRPREKYACKTGIVDGGMYDANGLLQVS
jgi:hypothetical protein